jgi:hypothetical protein
MKLQSTWDAAKKIVRCPGLMNAPGAAIVIFGTSRSTQLTISWAQSVSETSQSTLNGVLIEDNLTCCGLDCRGSSPPIESFRPRRSLAKGWSCGCRWR